MLQSPYLTNWKIINIILYCRTIHLETSVNHADTVEKSEYDKIRNEAGWGFPKFISLSEVESSTAHKQYLMNVTLYLKTSATVTK